MKSSYIKTDEEIHRLAEGGKILRHILGELAVMAQPGVSTAELNAYAEKAMISAGGRPSFIGYGPKRNPFPAGLCTSLNDVVVHGIPSEHEILKEGDVVGLDIGMEYKKMYTDTAITVGVGTVKPVIERLLTVTKHCLDEAIAVARVGNTIGDIGYTVQSIAEKAGFSVVRDLVGHGVGYEVHEDPMVPNYGKAGMGLKLQPGLVIAIEPMICEKDYHVFVDEDEWTIRTEDGGWAAHFEHTIAITEQGPKLLT